MGDLQKYTELIKKKGVYTLLFLLYNVGKQSKGSMMIESRIVVAKKM